MARNAVMGHDNTCWTLKILTWDGTAKGVYGGAGQQKFFVGNENTTWAALILSKVNRITMPPYVA
jgi:hypothetical protein